MADKLLLEDSSGGYQLEDASGVLLLDVAGIVTNFDYYISPTGSDANAGTLVSPWAITAINTKQATYSGKRLGILPGTYDVSAKMQAAGFQGAVLQIQGGTVGVPTYIGTSDASGNYLAGTATLDAKGSVGLYGGGNTTWSPYVIGQTSGGTGTGPQPTKLGNWTLDGLDISGHSNWAIVVSGYDGVLGNIPNVIIQNCTLHDSVSTLTSTHPGSIIVYRASNVLVSNCWLYNNKNTVADNVHYAGIMVFGSGGPTSGVVIEKCTFENSSCIYAGEDLSPVDNVTVRQCYFDMSLAGTNFNQYQAIMGFGNPGTGLIGSAIYNNIVKGGGLYDAYPTNPSKAPLSVYNNTWDRVGSNTNALGIRPVEVVGSSALFQVYNNLMYDNGSVTISNYGYIAGNVDGFSVLDYNIYGTIASKFYEYAASGGAALGAFTFASWKTATGKDAHSTTNATNPFTNNGARALAYQISSGSPAYQSGKVGGLIGGAALNVGAWDGVVTQIGYTAGVVAPTTGTATTSQASETIASAGKETDNGTGVAGQGGQTVVSVGGERITGAGVTANTETLDAAGTQILYATGSTAEAQTMAATGGEAIAATATSGQAQTLDSVGIETVAGADVTAQAQTAAGVGSAVSGVSGSTSTAQGAESLSGVASEGISGTLATGQGQSALGSGLEGLSGAILAAQGSQGAVGSGVERISGASASGQAQTALAGGFETIAGIASTGETQTSSEAGAERIAGSGMIAQAETVSGSGTSLTAGTGAATTAQAETASGAGLEWIAGVSVTAQAGTVTAAGLETVRGTQTSAQAQSILGAGSELFTGTATISQAQTVTGAGNQTLAAVTGTGLTSQTQTSSETGGELLTGTITTSQSESLAAFGLVAVPVTGSCITAQSETCDATDAVQGHFVGGGGGSILRHYRRPTLTLPTRIKITGRASTAQSAHSAGSGAVALPHIGRAVASSAQTSVGSGNVDNRKPINAHRARLLIALLQKAA